MIIKNYYSACIQIETPDLKILCDPWFTQGIADGAWHHFPFAKEPLKFIDKPDLVYISHIHNDHYDSLFLKKLFSRFGKKKIIIPKFKKNYLELRAKLDGFDVYPIEHLRVKQTNIHIIPNIINEDDLDINSALYVNYSKNNKNFLNLNDNIWNKNHSLKIKKIMNSYTKKLDLLALGYTGAGSYPHTFFDVRKEKIKLINEGKKKQEQFNKRYLQYSRYFPAFYNLPFAGTYILGGYNNYLNKYKANPDPIEIKKIDKKAIILKDFGGYINLNNNKIIGERIKKYSKSKINKRINELKKYKYDYEKDFNLDFEKINFKRMIVASFYKASKKISFDKNFYLIFNLMSGKKILQTYSLNLNYKNFKLKVFKNNKNLKIKQSYQIFIDYRYFFGLLSGLYHWSNAIGGSMFLTRRKPNNYNPNVENFLIFFQTN